MTGLLTELALSSVAVRSHSQDSGPSSVTAIDSVVRGLEGQMLFKQYICTVLLLFP